MKSEVLERLRTFEADLRELRKNVKAITTKTVNVKAIRNQAEGLANRWVEGLRSPLEHKFKISVDTINQTSEQVKRLHVLSRPSNLKASYLTTLDDILDGFKDKFILPIQQTSMAVESVFDLQKLVLGLPDPDESEYLKEAINCANSNFKKAAVVMGWCAAVDRIQKKIQFVGFAKFNSVSSQMKQQTSGRHKHFTKEFKIATLADLQTVFDSDLIRVCEGMQLLDSNQVDRLINVDFQYRNHSAHPGNAPIEDPHLVAFFTDINSIILTNPKFKLA
ncbi:MAG: hypothetical protein ABR973_03550 [Candidatus Acidiferrales bacterium]|jgi:hypothetical protein